MTMLIGQKCGMTRVFTEDGVSIPVTVVMVEPNRVVQVKDIANDGYRAIQITWGNQKPSRITKSLIGHYAKANAEAGAGLCEFRFEGDEGKDFQVGSTFKVDAFNVGDIVDVQGVSRGKGFAGVIKRYHFATQDASHGNSLSHRAPGSIGQRQTPGRVFPGKKMAGHMGNVTCTVQNQEIVRVDLDRNIILIKGGIPGAPKGIVLIKKAVKK